jgi:uncharacterized protein
LLPTFSSDLPLYATPGGIRIAVRLTPRAGADRLHGITHLADGTPVLKVSVTAPPVEGRANDALLQLLAKEWGVKRSDLAVVGGLKSRNKLVCIAGDAPTLMTRLGGALAAQPRDTRGGFG